MPPKLIQGWFSAPATPSPPLRFPRCHERTRLSFSAFLAARVTTPVPRSGWCDRKRMWTGCVLFSSEGTQQRALCPLPLALLPPGSWRPHLHCGHERTWMQWTITHHQNAPTTTCLRWDSKRLSCKLDVHLLLSTSRTGPDANLEDSPLWGENQA